MSVVHTSFAPQRSAFFQRQERNGADRVIREAGMVDRISMYSHHDVAALIRVQNYRLFPSAQQ